MEVKKGYKQTEVGVIPDDWNVKQLGSCLTRNPDYGINAPAVPYNDNLPTYLRITDISDNGEFVKENKVSVNHKLSTLYFLAVGDVVFARTGASVGKTYQYKKEDGELVFAGFLIRVKTDKKILLPELLKYNTQTKRYWNWVLSNSMRSGQPGLNSYEYKTYTFPLPPTISEQTAIATALSDADALISSLEKLIAKKRNIKQGAMQQLLQPKEGWVVNKLTDVVNYIHGKAHEQDIVDDGKYLVVNSKFISTEGEVVKFSNVNYCPAKKDDILTVLSDLPNGKALAKCFYITQDEKYAVNQRICIWRSKGANPRFLFYLLNRHKYFLGLDDGVSQTHILNKHIEACHIVIPNDVEQQRQIGEILLSMDMELKMLEVKLEKFKQIKQGMMQQLLTGKIRLV